MFIFLFIVLDNGVLINLNENAELELMQASRLPDLSKMQRFQVDGIDGSCLLHTEGSKAYFSRGEQLYGLSKRL